jgi:hypothetical protein
VVHGPFAASDAPIVHRAENSVPSATSRECAPRVADHSGRASVFVPRRALGTCTSFVFSGVQAAGAFPIHRGKAAGALTMADDDFDWVSKDNARHVRATAVEEAKPVALTLSKIRDVEIPEPHCRVLRLTRGAA